MAANLFRLQCVKIDSMQEQRQPGIVICVRSPNILIFFLEILELFIHHPIIFMAPKFHHDNFCLSFSCITTNSQVKECQFLHSC